MMADTMRRFRGRETMAAEKIRELREELLDLRRSREERSMVEGRLRSRRGMENYRLWALSVHNLPSFDIDKEIKVLQKICSEERNRYQSQLKRPKRNDLGSTANHRRTISCEKTKSIGGV